MKYTTLCFPLLATLLLVSCHEKEEKGSWNTYLPDEGTYSSIRTADLNQDGVLDIVMGAGGKEEVHSDTAVVAIDGKTGRPLWAIPGSNQYVGSAVFMDINSDKIPDVFIGGRWAQLCAINGADGKIIWSFFPERTKVDGSDGGWFNFTTPQFIPDQDKDGIRDIIIANGGDARAAPGDTNRPAGRILVIGSRSGRLLANVEVPDGKEIYMSVVCEEAAGKDVAVIFGTGGETISGHLYRTYLQDIMKGDISMAAVLATSDTKGFISSPVLADINDDRISDIIVNAVDGRMLAIDGATDSLIWQVSLPGTEAYTIPAIGFFNADSIPDLFANFAIGTFPRLNYSVRFMVDGKTGAMLYRDTIPAFQYASAIVADLDGDGYDEVIVNQSEMKKKQFENIYYSYLLAFDLVHKKNYPLGDTIRATNLACTPWIGDLDGDNTFDIVCSSVQYQGVKFDLQQPVGLMISRYQTGIPMKKPARWGAFMGSQYTGNYQK